MFTVVIPLYNKRHTIGRTLESVLAQSHAGFELIVVDDGSTDGGADIIAGRGDPRVRIIAQANAGPGAARNRGVAEAAHEWIAFLDGDDIWLPDHLAELDRVRSAHPDAGLIGCSYVDSDAQGRYVLPSQPPRRIGVIEYFAEVGSGRNVLWTSSAAVRKSVYDAVGGMRSHATGQDSELWARIALEWPVATSTRVTAVYVRGTGGISDTVRSRWLGRELRRIHDVSPTVALLIDSYERIESAAVRTGVDRYVDRYFHWCVRESVAQRDLRTLRALPRIYPRVPPPEDALLVALAFLPARVADAAYRIGGRIKRAVARERRIAAHG